MEDECAFKCALNVPHLNLHSNSKIVHSRKMNVPQMWRIAFKCALNVPPLNDCALKEFECASNVAHGIQMCLESATFKRLCIQGRRMCLKCGAF